MNYTAIFTCHKRIILLFSADNKPAAQTVRTRVELFSFFATAYQISKNHFSSLVFVLCLLVFLSSHCFLQSSCSLLSLAAPSSVSLLHCFEFIPTTAYDDYFSRIKHQPDIVNLHKLQYLLYHSVHSPKSSPTSSAPSSGALIPFISFISIISPNSNTAVPPCTL